ncbi:MAG: hypothetical protein KKC84_03875 [Candidatus Omnitrophica bacterium]|nr:hypothetical protein [Candidatus Omnitrophota bacterium]
MTRCATYLDLLGDDFYIAYPFLRKLCPFLFYQCVPYLFTLSNGGWFVWVRRKPRDYRKEIRSSDFKKGNANKSYPNEVLVRCINPEARIVVGVGPIGEKEFLIRVFNAEGICAHHYRAGDTMRLNEVEAGAMSLDFNCAFPRVLMRALKKRMPSCEEIRGVGKNRVCVSMRAAPGICRYHPVDRIFSDPFLPGSFCPHLFQVIYPFVLALMYDATIERELSIPCSIGEGQVLVRLIKQSRYQNVFVRSLANAIKKTSVRIYPLDIIDYRIAMKVMSHTMKKSECVLQNNVEYSVHVKGNDFLCPAAFHSLYPYWHLMQGGGLQREVAEDAIRVPCSDYLGILCTLSSRND